MRDYSFSQVIDLPEPPVEVSVALVRESLWIAGYGVGDRDNDLYDEDVLRALRLFAGDERTSFSVAVANPLTLSISPPSLVARMEDIIAEGEAGKTLYDLAAAVEAAHKNASVFKVKMASGLSDGTLTNKDHALYLAWIASTDEIQSRLRDLLDEDRDAFLTAAQQLRVDPQEMRRLLETPVTRLSDGKDVIEGEKAIPLWLLLLTVVAFLGAVVLVWDDVRRVIIQLLRTKQIAQILDAVEAGLIPREDAADLIRPIVEAEDGGEGGEPSLFSRIWDTAKPWVEVAMVVGVGAGAIWLLTRSKAKEKKALSKSTWNKSRS